MVIQWNRPKNTHSVEIMCFVSEGKPPTQKFSKSVAEVGDGLTYAKKLANTELYEKIVVRYI